MTDARAFRGFRVSAMCTPIANSQRRKNYWGGDIGWSGCGDCRPYPRTYKRSVIGPAAGRWATRNDA